MFGGGLHSTDDFQNIEDFHGSRSISGKNSIKIRSAVIKILRELLYP